MHKTILIIAAATLCALGRFTIPGHGLTGWPGLYETLAHIFVGVLLVLAWGGDLRTLSRLALAALIVLEVVMFKIDNAHAEDHGALHATGNYGEAYQRGIDREEAWARAQPSGDLYAFCDSTWAENCDIHALMLKDVCETTVRDYTDNSPRFWCALVDGVTRDAYLETLEPQIREKTFKAWREGR
jgi:hypothetical protein